MQFYLLILSFLRGSHITSYYLDTYKKKKSNQIYNRNVAVKFIMCFNIQGWEGHIWTFLWNLYIVNELKGVDDCNKKRHTHKNISFLLLSSMRIPHACSL
jgi:hypothetical protein